MAQRGRRIPQQPQRDEPRGPFQIRIDVPRFGCGVVNAGNAIGSFGVAIAHVLPGQGHPAFRPFVRLAQQGGGLAAFQQQLDGVFVAALLAVAPDESRMGQTRRIAQRFGDRLDSRIHAGGHVIERDPRFGELALALVHQRHHPPGALHVAVPQHPVEPRGVMWRQQLAVFFEVIALHGGAHRHRAPGHHQFGFGVTLVACGGQYGSMAQHALGRLRRIFGKESNHRVAPGADNGGFAAPAQPGQPRPVRAAVEKLHRVRSRSAARPQPVPFDDVARYRSRRAGRRQRRIPVARAHLLEGGVQRLR